MFNSKSSDKPLCPLLNKPCIERKCQWFTRIQGVNPQTKAEMDMEDCSIKWLPVLLIENSKETRMVGADINSLRNENVTTGSQIAAALMHVASTNSQQLLRAGDEN